MEDKHTKIIRGFSKFLSGLIVADILVGLWVRSGGVTLNQPFLGFSITNSLINIWLVIDAFLLITLIFYGWHIKLPVLKVHKPILVIIGSLFTIISLLHFLRLAYSIPVVIGGISVPMWLSVLGTVVTGFLAYASFYFSARK
jgi:hypothetical protein